MNDSLIKRHQDRLNENKQLDGMTAKQAAEKVDFNPVAEKAFVHATGQLRLGALDTVFTLTSLVAEDGQEDDDAMLPSELLDGLMLDVFDLDDEDDDLDDTAKTTLAAHVADAFASLGVDDDVIDDMFDSDTEVADVAIENACNTVLDNLPNDDDLDDFIAQFAFGEEADTDKQMDGMGDDTQFDSGRKGGKKLQAGKTSTKKVNGKTIRYKAVKVIRNGKMKVVNKRISGKIKLSAKQKASLKKARNKIHGSSIRRRTKSWKKGRKIGYHLVVHD